MATPGTRLLSSFCSQEGKGDQTCNESFCSQEEEGEKKKGKKRWGEIIKLSNGRNGRGRRSHGVFVFFPTFSNTTYWF